MQEKEKGTDKKKALLDATLYLVNNKGFHDAPMSKIAKLAQVSAGTIYLYFENKQDLINQLYLCIKEDYSQAAFCNFDPNASVKEGFKTIWYNIARYKIQEVDKALFLSNCELNPMIGEDIKRKGLLHLQPLLELWERGKKEQIIDNYCNYLLYAFSINPLSFLLNVCNESLFDPNDDNLANAFELAWNSIKK